MGKVNEYTVNSVVKDSFEVGYGKCGVAVGRGSFLGYREGIRTSNFGSENM